MICKLYNVMADFLESMDDSLLNGYGIVFAAAAPVAFGLAGALFLQWWRYEGGLLYWLGLWP